MEHTAIFEEQVAFTPKDMRKHVESIDTVLLEKLQGRLEGRCSRNGYVVPGSLKTMSRSMGSVEKGRFTGSILFQLQAEADVINPPDGTVIEGEVIRKNKMGMYVSYKDAIRVIIPRDLHIGNEKFEAVQVGEWAKVEIKKSRFQVNDPYILSVGVFLDVVKGGTKAAKAIATPGASSAAAAAAATAEDSEEGEGTEDAEGEGAEAEGEGAEAEGEEAEGEEGEEAEGEEAEGEEAEGEEGEEGEEAEGEEGEEGEDEEATTE
jgi:DNA-directed RNA polymerase subunit E'/Rpb7